MSFFRSRRFLAWTAAVGVYLSVALSFFAEACSVPVFRWALERWPADQYELIIFHEKPLSPGDHARIHSLEQRIENTSANLQVRSMDVTQSIMEHYLPAWKKVQGGPLPMGLLLYPHTAHVVPPLWQGALNELFPETLLDSPARREIKRRLLDGQSGVWLLLPSGNQAKDAAAAKLLAQQIDHANKTLHLPDMTGDNVLKEPETPDSSNLRVEFSVLTVDRENPDEAILIRMLLGSEPDLSEYSEPMAFPVYGRGRVLYALVGQGINPDTILKANAFLVGRCACEIKVDNPGADLLMPVDWEKSIGDTAICALELPPLPGTAIINDGVSETARKEDPAARSFARNAIITVLAAFFLVLAATWVLTYRRRNK
ncbi:MAG TPA: hypothetical protein PLI09_10895 [Candidatus Hydrogenedentes bacterium]|nr:hypothetical protein [Candidatus Hydrogenedentota bacterium]